jgi:hypothetical protein
MEGGETGSHAIELMRLIFSLLRTCSLLTSKGQHGFQTVDLLYGVSGGGGGSGIW